MPKQVLDSKTNADRTAHAQGATLVEAATGRRSSSLEALVTPVIGVLPGEGIGPDMLEAALMVLAAVKSVSELKATIETGGPIGLEAEATDGRPLSDQVIEFCTDIFSRRGAILAGPGGGRFVYDLRREFDLYCKFSPLKPHPQLDDSGHIRTHFLESIDIMIVRDNVAGLYLGRSDVSDSPTEGKCVAHQFSYTEVQVRRLIEAGARLAASRSRKVTVVVKASGLPQISELWSDVTAEVCEQLGVEYVLMDADHCAYQLIQNPQQFDVLIAANMLGDILADLGAVLLGSRGLSFSGNFSPNGDAVYQTNHGSAYDLMGQDRANPVAQIFALAMMLRQSFHLEDQAEQIEHAVAHVWKQGWRTEDLAMPNHRVVGTREFAALIADAIAGRTHR